MNKTSGKTKIEARKSSTSRTTHSPIISKPIIQRNAINPAKFPSPAAKMAQITKAVPGTSSIAPTNQSPILSRIAISSPTSIPANSTILKRKIPPRALPLIPKSGERIIPLLSESTGKLIPLQKKLETSNGCVYVASTQQISQILPAHLSITPVTNAIAKVVQIPGVSPKASPQLRKYQCNRCKKPCLSADKCDNCKTTAIAVSSAVHLIKGIKSCKAEQTTPITKGPIIKELFYGNKAATPQDTTPGNNFSRQAPARKVFVTPDHQGKPRGRPKGSKNRVAEPECLTILSSDDEEQDDEAPPSHPRKVSTLHQTLRKNSYTAFQDGMRTPKIQRNNNQTPTNCVKRNADSSAILSNEEASDVIEEEEEEIEEELEDEEEEDEEDEEQQIELNISQHPRNNRLSFNEEGKPRKGTKVTELCCRSIRIGSFKIHPLDDMPHLPVVVSPESFSFHVSKATKASDIAYISLKGPDIVQVLGHFGRCLPIIFILTTPACAARIRFRLGMIKGNPLYYDPEVDDEKQKRITLLIDNMTEDIRNYLRKTFPGEGILREIDQKSANEILVKSTPNQQMGMKNMPPTFTTATVVTPTPVSQIPLPPSPAVQLTVQPTIETVVQNLQSQGTVTVAVTMQPLPTKENAKPDRPSSPVRKILTYPPPPQTGGILITNEDVACLEEGEFLNDSIIDFFLRYLAMEILSEEDRKRTHVFNSYFFQRLTQKPAKRSSGDDSSMAERRHSQVKTWTKNTDIFEKDFIIIPINQNVHWYLAIVCYPKLAAGIKKPPTKISMATFSNKSTDNNVPPDHQTIDMPSSNNCLNLLINTISPVKALAKTREQACDTNMDCENCQDNSPHEYCPSAREDADPSCMELPDTTQITKPKPGQKSPCIIIFDSLTGPSRWRVAGVIKEYLEMEWKSKKGSAIPFDRGSVLTLTADVPQQTNYSDCGIFVLQYVQSFFESPFPYIDSPLADMKNWFSTETVAAKREEIKCLIFGLEKRQSSSATPSNSDNKQNSIKHTEDMNSSQNSTQTS